jgi:SM-20-related protein
MSPVLDFINADSIWAGAYNKKPYPHFLGVNFLKAEVVPTLREEFPDITKSGYLTVDDVMMRENFRKFIDELESPELTDVLSERFGMDLHPYPRLTTIRKWSQSKDGRIHTDGPSKIMTMLVYMNDEWNAAEDGRLRVLYDEHKFEPFAREIPPTMGTVFGFLRTDNSWHGHKPFAGERRVVQVAWIKDSAELERKMRRNNFSQKLKRLFG